jgi:predicted PurR-regulated permease PerM
LNDFFDGLKMKKGELPDLSLFYAPVSGIWSTAKRVPALIVAGVITIISCFFVTADYDRIVDFIKRQLPEDKRRAVSHRSRSYFPLLGG